MTRAIGIRLPKEIMGKINRLSMEEAEDRSTIIRKLLIAGYNDVAKKKAASQYISGRITISEAAKRAGLTLWEMEKYLVEQGFRSEYSIEDLEKELKLVS